MTETTADVVVVGGGVIGCAVARHAARGGASVVVVERGRPGDEASTAAAGMLSPQAEADEPGPMLDLLLRAREAWPAFVEALRGETGIDVPYSDAGTLLLALREEDDAAVAERYRWQSAAGLRVERLDADDVRRLEPAVTPAVRSGLCFPGDHQVATGPLARALWAAAAGAGARFLLGAEAGRVLAGDGRAAGVELAGGARIAAATVVVAGGCWSGRLGGLPRTLPVEPVHGQVLALETIPAPLRHVVDSPRCYLVPRPSGRVLVGATMERTGFRKAVTADGVRRLIDGAVELVPALGDAPMDAAWSGLRPGTPDGLPILGRDPQLPGLLYATGHFRNGILLAPLTGERIGALAVGGHDDDDLRPFRAERFDTSEVADEPA